MPTRKPAGTIMIGLFLLSSLVMGSAWAAASGCGNVSRVASNPDSGLIETPRVACNRALSLHVHSAHLADGFDGREPLPGHRWLLLRAPTGLDALDFSYSGVSGRSTHRVRLP